MHRFLLAFLLAIAPSALLAADAVPPATATPATAATPAPLKPFAKSQLTAAQLATCAAFKAKSGKDRRDEARAVSRALLEFNVMDGKPVGMGHPTSLITVADITDLLGKPDSTVNGNLNYFIDTGHGNGWNMDIALDKDGHLSMIIFVD